MVISSNAINASGFKFVPFHSRSEEPKWKKLIASSARFFCFCENSLSEMMTSVLGMSKHFKVFYSVIKFIMIDVVDNLCAFKLSADMKLKNVPVFINRFFINHNANITFRGKASRPPRRVYNFIRVALSFPATVVHITKSVAEIFLKTIFDFACFHTMNNSHLKCYCQQLEVFYAVH